MSSVSSATSTSATSTSATSTAVTGTTDLGEDTFLLLLTTQMQNQDPLSPMSNEEFVAQLAQFSSLEELKNISSGLEALYLVDSSMNNAAMVNLLGQTVVARTDAFHYPGEGDIEFNFDAAAAASEARVTVTYEDGTVVFEGAMGSLDEGEGSWTWNGLTTDGTPAEAGDYTFSVTGTAADGSEVTVEELLLGEVDEMSFEAGTASPSVAGTPISIGDILRIVTPEEAP